MIQYGKIALSCQEVSWTQPLMSSSADNGTLGGNKFACTLQGALSGFNNPYVLFNGSSSANVTENKAYYGSAATTITLYNPDPLNITLFTLQQGGSNANGGLHSGTIYGSNDGSNWIYIDTYSGLTANAELVTEYINLSNNTNFLKYYQIRNSTGGTHGVVLSEITITATYLSSALNSIIFPLAYSTNNYGASFSYINGSSNNAYISSKSNTGLTLDGVDINSTSATWITVGY